MRLQLADILIRQEQRPSKALRVLSGIPADQLNQQTSAQVARLRNEPEKQIAEGALELEEDEEDV